MLCIRFTFPDASYQVYRLSVVGSKFAKSIQAPWVYLNQITFSSDSARHLYIFALIGRWGGGRRCCPLKKGAFLPKITFGNAEKSFICFSSSYLAFPLELECTEVHIWDILLFMAIYETLLRHCQTSFNLEAYESIAFKLDLIYLLLLYLKDSYIVFEPWSDAF